MMRNLFAGVGVALITPFKEDYTVDYDALKNLLVAISNSSVDYLVVNGTTSEASTLTADDKNKILSFIKENNNKKLPIMYGVGANDTNFVLESISAMDFEGIDAILTVTPYYNKPSQQGIFAHYTAIASASPVPVLLYNVPGRTGINMTAATTLKLAENPNIFGIKEASGNVMQALEIIKDKPAEFMLISGDDMMTVPLISIGCEGVISVLANGYPVEFSNAIQTALKQDYDDATSQVCGFLGINDLLYEESNPVGIKEVLKLKGICGNNVRLPLMPASDNLSSRISQEHEILQEYFDYI